MNEITNLDANYSTTRRVIKLNPSDILESLNKSERSKDKPRSILFLPKDDQRIGEGGLRSNGYIKKSSNNKPLISVITVVYNGVNHLEETIESVINQSYDNVEYIVIDGGSNDGTFDIIKKYEDKIDYWVSETDEGIYDAMNKGISLSSGDIIGIINADDYYLTDTLNTVQKEFNKDIDILYSDCKFLDIDKLTTRKSNHNLLNIKMSIFHPSVFIRKSIYQRYGFFDSSLKISADYKFLHFLYKKNKIFKKANDILTVIRLGGVSTNSRLAIEETFEIQKNNSLFFAYVFKYLRLLKRSLKLI